MLRRRLRPTQTLTTAKLDVPMYRSRDSFENYLRKQTADIGNCPTPGNSEQSRAPPGTDPLNNHNNPDASNDPSLERKGPGGPPPLM